MGTLLPEATLGGMVGQWAAVEGRPNCLAEAVGITMEWKGKATNESLL
jgi:hypothetical protein